MTIAAPTTAPPLLLRDGIARGRTVLGAAITSANAQNVCKPEPNACGALSNLNEYATAAINALRSRDDDKKQLAKDQRQANRAAVANAAQTPAGESDGMHDDARLTSSSSTRMTKGGKPNVGKNRGNKRSAAHARKAAPKEYIIATRDMPKPPAVGTDLPARDYKGGRIYWKGKARMFRIIRARGVYNTERQVKWSKSTPVKSEWTTALGKIDEYDSSSAPSIKADKGVKRQIKTENVANTLIKSEKLVKKGKGKMVTKIPREVCAKKPAMKTKH